MMVRYRLIEDWLAEEGIWFTWGMFYENCSGTFTDFTLLIRAIPDDDRRKGRYFDQRIQELRPRIEEAEVVLGEYAGRYRVLPEIRTVEGEDHSEIHARLWQVLCEEMERRQPRGTVRPVQYHVESAYHPLREGSEEED
jgi:hypothetical protein